jgi:WD40 repeat protein
VLTRLDVETGERTHLPVEILGEVPRAIDVGRDDRLVAFATQSSKDSEKVNQIAVWDLASGRHVAKFDHGERAVNTLALSPDGTTLASDGVYEGLEHVVIVREIATRRELAKLTGRDAAEFLSLAFSPDGRRLAAGSSKGEILVWNVRDRRRLGVLSTGHNRVTHLAFSPDGQRLASADGTGGAIRVWNISLEALQARACHAANRQLTEQEWSIVGGADTADHNPCGR